MNVPPRRPAEPILGRIEWISITLQSMILSAGVFAALWIAINAGWSEEAVVTTTFLTIAFTQLWHVFDMRDRSSSLFFNEVTRNPWVWGAVGLCCILLAVPPYLPLLAEVLHLAPPTRAMWGVILVCSITPMVFVQFAMLAMRLMKRRPFDVAA